MRILVTGGAGYIGSVLVPILISRGHRVRVIDCGMFGTDQVDPAADLIVADILSPREGWFADMDAVVHLAGLSNDPMAAFSPSLNYLLNASGPAIVAHAAKEAGIQRFVFGSTCSVYGLSDDGEVDEEHDASPAFPYAVSKLMGERAISCLGDERFRTIILRKGTVVGWSPRMRFDLVTNTMVKSALTEGKIVAHNADLWRPLIDVRDAASAYIAAAEADLTITGMFNIAGQNYSIGELADEVASTLREFDVEAEVVKEERHDLRSYRVSTAKAARELEFRAEVQMNETIRVMMREIRRLGINDFANPKYYNVEQMKRALPGGATVSEWVLKSGFVLPTRPRLRTIEREAARPRPSMREAA